MSSTSSASASAGTVTQDAKTKPEYEITESAYAVPHVYEYAILGPNEQKVIICVTLNCQYSGWLITVSTSGITSTSTRLNSLYTNCLWNVMIFCYACHYLFEHQLPLRGFIKLV